LLKAPSLTFGKVPANQAVCNHAGMKKNARKPLPSGMLRTSAHFPAGNSLRQAGPVFEPELAKQRQQLSHHFAVLSRCAFKREQQALDRALERELQAAGNLF
jgi:hypothetical protein